MNTELSEFDRRLLDDLQRSVPLVARPYQQIASRLGASEAEVIDRVSVLGSPGGVLREIAGIFDAAALGYASTLVAARCDPDRLERAGRTVAAHPGVSHCYAREADDWSLNLWFTLAVAPDSALGLDRTVEVLRRLIGAEQALSLPTLRRYKLDVRFDLGGQGENLESTPRPARLSDAGADVSKEVTGAVTDDQIRAIRALQEPLPALREPFLALSQPVGLSADDLLVHAADILAGGIMRRYAAVLRHRSAGLKANVLVAWQVPEDQADAFGAKAARFRAVSHCYLRPAGAGWPYNLYTMVHGRSREEVEAVIDAIAEAAGEYPRASLATTQEFKKEKLRLFSPAFAQWEEAFAG